MKSRGWCCGWPIGILQNYSWGGFTPHRVGNTVSWLCSPDKKKKIQTAGQDKAFQGNGWCIHNHYGYRLRSSCFPLTKPEDCSSQGYFCLDITVLVDVNSDALRQLCLLKSGACQFSRQKSIWLRAWNLESDKHGFECFYITPAVKPRACYSLSLYFTILTCEIWLKAGVISRSCCDN